MTRPPLETTGRPSLEAPSPALCRQESLLRNLVDSSVDGIFVCEVDGRIVLFNRGAERLLGYTAEEATAGLDVSALFAPGTAAAVLECMRSGKHGGVGQLTRHEVTAIAKGGAEIPVSLSGGILYDEAGREEAVFGIFRDLRKLQEIQQRLLQSEKMAGLGRLAAGVAHEINNPLSGILLFGHLVLERLGEAHPVAEDLRVVIREAERCKEIVAELLQFSQKGEPRHESVNVNEEVRRALSVVSKLPLWQGLELRLELEEGLSPIWGDATKFGQVVTNLLVNAAQALEGQGRVTVCSRHRRDQDLVELVVSDNGPGIAPEIQSKIFDPFFTTRAAKGGTGLGLSLCYAAVKEHKGTIRVESRPGQGATFRVWVPALQIAVANDEAL